MNSLSINLIKYLILAVLIAVALLFVSVVSAETKGAADVAPECNQNGLHTRSVGDASDEMVRQIVANFEGQEEPSVSEVEFAGVVYMQMEYRKAVYDLVVCLLEVIDRKRSKFL